MTGVIELAPEKIDLPESPTAAEIVGQLYDAEGAFLKPRVKEAFIWSCQEVLDAIDTERAAQGINLYTRDQKVILVGEFYRTLVNYKDYEPRKDGTNTFFSHLVGAVLNVVRLMGFTGLGTVLAVLKHDSVEDFVPKEMEGKERDELEEKHYGSLIDTSPYLHLLNSYDASLELKLREDVIALVKGVTKLRRKDRDAEESASFDNILRIAADILKVIVIKLPDRMHNVLTMAGHGDDEVGRKKQQDKMDETDLVHLAFARVLRMREVVKFLVYQLLRFAENPVLKEFETFQKARLAVKLDKYREKILEQFNDMPKELVESVEFVPRGLDYYSADFEKPLSQLQFSDLAFRPKDPMFDIVVQVKPLAPFKPSVKGNSQSDDDYAKMVQAEEYKYRERVLHHLERIKTFLYRKFARGPGVIDEGFTPHVGDALEVEGIGLSVFNLDFGGELAFRINPSDREAQLKRGVYARNVSTSRESSNQAIAEITAHINELIVEIGNDREISKEEARHRFLRSHLVVKDRDGRSRRFPKGATGLDFANSVHRGLVFKLGKLYMEDDMTPDGANRDRMRPSRPPVEVSPLDPLIPGKVYTVEQLDHPTVKPASKRFAKGPARKTIGYYLRGHHIAKKSEREAWQQANGEEYLRDVSRIFSVNEEELVNLIYLYKYRGYGTKTKSEKKRKIVSMLVGSGEIDPIDVLASIYDGKRDRAPKAEEDIIDEDKLWHFEIIIPDVAGSFGKYFGEEFSKEVNINIYRTKSHEKLRNPKREKLVYIVDIEDQNLSIADFFTKLLKLGVKYPVRLVNNPCLGKE